MLYWTQQTILCHHIWQISSRRCRVSRHIWTQYKVTHHHKPTNILKWGTSTSGNMEILSKVIYNEVKRKSYIDTNTQWKRGFNHKKMLIKINLWETSISNNKIFLYVLKKTIHTFTNSNYIFDYRKRIYFMNPWHLMLQYKENNI